MNPTTEHTDDPATCPACVIEGRALFNTVQYTEMEPLGPQSYGDHGSDAQATDAFGRRFFTSRYDGTYAVIDVVYLGERNECDQAAQAVTMQLTTYTICTDLADVGGTEVYSDERGRELADITEYPTDERMRELAANFDPATLDWNGAPDGHLECDGYLVNAKIQADGVSYVPPLRLCRTHPGSHTIANGSTEVVAEDFACDRNMGWQFLLEYDDPDADVDPSYPLMVANLSRVRAAIRSSVLNREYEPASALRIYRYAGPGVLEPLQWRPVPHGNAGWRHVDDDDRKPVVADSMYEVVGPHPEGGGRLVQYLTVGVLMHGDS